MDGYEMTRAFIAPAASMMGRQHDRMASHGLAGASASVWNRTPGLDPARRALKLGRRATKSDYVPAESTSPCPSARGGPGETETSNRGPPNCITCAPDVTEVTPWPLSAIAVKCLGEALSLSACGFGASRMLQERSSVAELAGRSGSEQWATAASQAKPGRASLSLVVRANFGRLDTKARAPTKVHDRRGTRIRDDARQTARGGQVRGVGRGGRRRRKSVWRCLDRQKEKRRRTE
ncbi:hypothetical protein GGR56DRAFT_447733 [Xylariaceae sp. FL0804]|nr:hypothetical protein GGR56DRAFT_447733 [Xylariaceae sp. FL0804]